MLVKNYISLYRVLVSHINVITDSLNDISKVTLIYDYRQAMAIRHEIDKITAELESLRDDAYFNGPCTREAFEAAKAKADKLHEAAMAATSTTFDDECNLRWLNKLYELGIR